MSTRTVTRVFGKNDIFNLDKGRNGFQIAFGLTEYPIGSEEIYNHPEYAEVKIAYQMWGQEDVTGTESHKLT